MWCLDSCFLWFLSRAANHEQNLFLFKSGIAIGVRARKSDVTATHHAVESASIPCMYVRPSHIAREGSTG